MNHAQRYYTAETSDEITVIVRTADQARKEVFVSHDTTCGELIANARKLSLDSSIDYSIANVTQNLALTQTQQCRNWCGAG